MTENDMAIQNDMQDTPVSLPARDAQTAESGQAGASRAGVVRTAAAVPTESLPETQTDSEIHASRHAANSSNEDQARGGHDIDDGIEDRAADASAAMAALISDEGAQSVEDPHIDPNAQPIELQDLPDDTPATAKAPEPAETPGPHAPSDQANASPNGPAANAAGTPQPQSQESDDPQATAEIDKIELAALMNSTDAGQTMPFAAVQAEPAKAKPASDRVSGTAKRVGALAWGSRSDVGLVREHNEDSFVVQFPLFAVADGMGGHEAGEVASAIAVSRLAEEAPETADDAALAAAVEAANRAVIEGPSKGTGRAGMGTTCTAVVIDGSTMAVAHVGDSRCYLLHKGQLMRVTHDHSYVEELVAAGQITPEEARIHPNRSVITRALGNDPSMRADHFSVDVTKGDRVLLCSDGLSSMVTDGVIEETLMSCTTPQACADALVDAALSAGGSDNVTCIVIDVKNDGVADRALKARLRNLGVACAIIVALAAIVFAVLEVTAQNSWYLTDYNGYVALHRGIEGLPSNLGFDETVEVTTVETSKLSDTVSKRLEGGIAFGSEAEARNVIEDYRAQIARANTEKDREESKIAQGEADEASDANQDATPSDAQAQADASTSPASDGNPAPAQGA